MAENHYVDPVDQTVAAEGVADHSDLTVFYAEAKKEDLGPWMQEADRQKALQDERDAIQAGLRRSVVQLGLGISLPIVLGVSLVQLALSQLNIEDIGAAGPLFFIVIVLVPTLAVTTLLLFKWVRERFHRHNLRALPVMLTTILSLALIIQRLFHLFDSLIGGTAGYIIAMLSVLTIGMFIVTVSVYIWTSPKLTWAPKLLVLLAFVGASAALYYLG